MTFIYHLFDKTLVIIISEYYHLLKQEYNKMAGGRPLGHKSTHTQTSAQISGQVARCAVTKKRTMKLMWHQERRQG